MDVTAGTGISDFGIVEAESIAFNAGGTVTTRRTGDYTLNGIIEAQNYNLEITGGNLTTTDRSLITTRGLIDIDATGGITHGGTIISVGDTTIDSVEGFVETLSGSVISAQNNLTIKASDHIVLGGLALADLSLIHI